MKNSYGNLNDALLHSTTYNGFGEECITAIETINEFTKYNFQKKLKRLNISFFLNLKIEKRISRKN